ncbi:MAG: Rrf2 family transcriptional regulator [Chloroflexota bacterium]
MTKDRTLTTAIHILTALAYSQPELVNSEYLSTSLQTNPGLVRRMLSKLVKANLVESVKGKHGGYRLVHPTESIDLKMIYEAIDAGPLLRSFEKEPFALCPVSCQIGGVLCDVYEDLEDALLAKMADMPLSNIVNQIR